MNRIEFIREVSQKSDRLIGNVVKLFDEGATIPFVARYRKEQTGGMDEVELEQIKKLSQQFDELEKRKETILKAIEEQGGMDKFLEDRIRNCFDPVKLEDIYLPFKKKRSSKAEIARKNGLEPLAKMIMSQRDGDPEHMAERFLRGELTEPEDAIAGAVHIMAEWINENENLRDRLRMFFEKRSVITSKVTTGKESIGEKYRDYFDHSERLKNCPSHRFLAISRGANEGVLKVTSRPETKEAVEIVERFFVKGNGECSEVVRRACKDAYSRLLRPSLENEVWNKKKLEADQSAIRVFSKNLRQLLLAPPLGNKRILAIDPGFRTGCKIVCLDNNGDLKENTTIFPHPPQKESGKAKSKIAQLVQAHKIEAIAIGDGTAGRETERLVKSIQFDKDIEVYVVREDGASIYSASKIGREEFPSFDVTVRGSVSIGRRLMDPLAELVKIDPKSIGVGQYQHEVDQNLLKEELDNVVVSCVNKVGVDLNTASPYLLSYVSGLGPALAANIVEYRSKLGGFSTRKQLHDVPRLGGKAFEQCAGFLKVKGDNPLDNSSVHPESYKLVEAMAKKVGASTAELIENGDLLKKLKKEDFPEVDAYTFEDVVKELQKPGRDPRQQVKVLEFDHRLKEIGDVIPGMKINGIITNVTNFGAFVNIGIKENGLIHKSNMADHYIEDPSEVVSLHEHVEIEVIEVDLARKRIGLRLM